MSSLHFRWLLVSALFAAAAGSLAFPVHAAPSYTLFESGQVRPLALSPDRTQLFALNTPDGRLEVFDVKHSGLKHRISIPVGLEPVAVAARSNDEVWVVNHVSDSVSVVYVGHNAANRVVRTLLVGDEPRDIVFAGPQKNRAFITTAHRGQNSPIDPELTTPGVGRADVWVFDASHLGTSLGGTPLTILTLFSDTPRALAASADGAKVYAAAFFSGNRTTVIHRATIPNLPEELGGPPAPNTNYAGIAQPDTPLILKYDGIHWVDEIGRSYDDRVRFDLPDKDVFVIDAMADTPAEIPGPSGFYTGVGTTLFNMIVNPASGKVYVSNTDARNHVRFEGPALFADTTVRGHIAESRITVLDGTSVLPRHLNKHILYDVCCDPAPSDENQRSLAFPLDMAISSDGTTLYVAALGSSKIGVFDTGALENDTFWPDATTHIPVSGGGPTGLALDEDRHRLYVLTRFDNAVSIVDTTTGVEQQHLFMHNPEPESVTLGRQYLYDATFTSSHGDSACASCHIFADMDHLAWDLGNPDADMVIAPGPFRAFGGPNVNFHPMKGPLTTQSLRGMANHGPMHWRGDRTGGYYEPSAQPDSGSFDEEEAFRQFNPAFVGLVGRDSELSAEDMQAFTDFILQVTYPPNPIRALDNSLTPDEQAGRDLYFNVPREPGITCSFCHVLDPDGNAEFGVAAPGFFGTDGFSIGDEVGQTFKVPHLRNAYQKVGMFGMVGAPYFPPSVDGSFTGDQIRGFGFNRDGALPTIFRFLRQGFSVNPFNPTGFAIDATGDLEIRQVEAFLFAFDSNLAPIVGQQVTLTSTNAATAGPRIDLLIERADTGECDLIVHGQVGREQLGFRYSGGHFVGNKSQLPPIPDALLRSLAKLPYRELTYTCAPPGSGQRMALDRDLDGILDGDEHAN